jgi:hypothetical protein
MNTWKKLHKRINGTEIFLPVTLVMEFTCAGENILKLSVVCGGDGAGGYPLPAFCCPPPPELAKSASVFYVNRTARRLDAYTGAVIVASRGRCGVVDPCVCAWPLYV